jgi:hypothetical protein
MGARKFSLKRVIGRMGLATAALSGLLLFAGVSNAEARDRDDCQRRVNKAEWKFNEAVERHGFNSRQAFERREKVREERARCFREGWREHRRDWDRDRR